MLVEGRTLNESFRIQSVEDMKRTRDQEQEIKDRRTREQILPAQERGRRGDVED